MNTILKIKLDVSTPAKARKTIRRIAKCVVNQNPGCGLSDAVNEIKMLCVKHKIPYEGTIVEHAADREVNAHLYKRPKQGYGFS